MSQQSRLDQADAIEQAERIADVVAVYFHALCDRNVPEKLACQLTRVYHALYATNQLDDTDDGSDF